MTTTNERKFKFELQQEVRTKYGIEGKIVARQHDGHRPHYALVMRDGVESVTETLVPVDSYQILFTDEAGRMDMAWWHDDMITAVESKK